MIDGLIGKVDINCHDEYGRNALMLAICAGNPNGYEYNPMPWLIDVVSRLLAAGIDVDTMDVFGYTCMSYTLRTSPFIPQIASLLLACSSHGINKLDQYGFNYLIFCKPLDSYKFCVENGIVINYIYPDGETIIDFLDDYIQRFLGIYSDEELEVTKLEKHEVTKLEKPEVLELEEREVTEELNLVNSCREVAAREYLIQQGAKRSRDL